RISKLGDQQLPIFGVGQKPEQGKKRRAGRFEQGEQSIPQDVFHARSPELAVEFLEGGDDARSDEWPHVRPRTVQEVERQWMVAIGRVEEDYVIRPRARDGRQDGFTQ